MSGLFRKSRFAEDVTGDTWSDNLAAARVCDVWRVTGDAARRVCLCEGGGGGTYRGFCTINVTSVVAGAAVSSQVVDIDVGEILVRLDASRPVA
jgi:hypothetical protein